jgi:methanesulfonate monooxygenase small subunit
MTERVTPETRSALDELLQLSALYLDERRFGEWLALTASEFNYRIQAYSPDLRKDMTWLDHDRAGLSALIELLPKHHTTGADWLRQVVLGTAASDAQGGIRTVSSLALFETAVDVGDAHLDGGSSRLLLVGRYYDHFRLERGDWFLAERTVKLQTRQLGIGTHLFP